MFHVFVCNKITYRIPDLTLNFHIFIVNELGGEFDTDCRLGVLKELILGVPGYEIGFSDTGVTDYDHCGGVRRGENAFVGYC